MLYLLFGLVNAALYSRASPFQFHLSIILLLSSFWKLPLAGLGLSRFTFIYRDDENEHIQKYLNPNP